MSLNRELVQYITDIIFPKYEKYYSHGMIHINNVIENMMMLADYYGLDKDMAYTIASYHDIGLNVDRENHEKESAKILKSDKKLREFFTEPQIEIMAIAIEDHRGSRREKPHNIYGECISDSDRDFDVLTLAKRQLATTLKNYPDLETFDEHFNRCYEYICERINENGVFNLWTNNPVLIKRRDKFQKEYLDKDYTRGIYKKEWDKISSDGTKEKIITYYEDY
ncbi:HD domain-containing protein [Candidatus Saccharibacteria bacterium]|nr:HD domain-containing protein [Candidatus Saccharibacteria bacterium]